MADTRKFDVLGRPRKPCQTKVKVPRKIARRITWLREVMKND